MSNNNMHLGGVNQTLQGFYKIAVVDSRTEEVTWESDWKKNLILNQGMDAVGTNFIADLMLYGLNGTGTRPNSISSGDSYLTQSGAIVTILPGATGLPNFTSSYDVYTSALQVGDMFKYANNSESVVTLVTSGLTGLSASVSPSYTIPLSTSQSFTIWKTSQVGLQSEYSRSNAGSYALTGWPNQGFQDSGNTRTFRRTYDFGAQNATANFNEVGVAWATTGATKVFSRVTIPTLTIDAPYKMRLIYDLAVTYTPATAEYVTASIGGWPAGTATNTIGSQSIQSFLTSKIGSNGTTDGTLGCLDPGSVGTGAPTYFPTVLWISDVSASLSAFSSSTNRAAYGTFAFVDAQGTKTYTNGSYILDISSTFTEAQQVSNNIRSMGLGVRSSGASVLPYSINRNAFCFVFNQEQTKQSTQTLSLTWRFSWGRTLA